MRVAAGDVNADAVFAFRADFIQAAGASAHTGAARRAFVFVDDRNSCGFVQADGAERASPDTVSETKTAVGTAAAADGNAGGHSAAFHAGIDNFVRRILAGSVAFENSDGRFSCLGDVTEFCGDFIHNLLSAGCAEQLFKLICAAVGTGNGKGMAACFAASTAVGAGQQGFDFGNFRVFLYPELLRNDIKDNGGRQSGAAQDQNIGND